MTIFVILQPLLERLMADDNYLIVDASGYIYRVPYLT